MLTQRMHEVEAEYNEPLAEIITGFRAQGQPWRVIAEAMGIRECTLRRWRADLGIPDKSPDCLRRIEQPDPAAPPILDEEQVLAYLAGLFDALASVQVRRGKDIRITLRVTMPRVANLFFFRFGGTWEVIEGRNARIVWYKRSEIHAMLTALRPYSSHPHIDDLIAYTRPKRH